MNTHMIDQLRKAAGELADYFESIPDERWMVGWAASPDLKKFCAWGHLIYENKYDEAQILEMLLGMFPDKLARYNNGDSGTGYDILKTPRERIVAVLRDICSGRTKAVWEFNNTENEGDGRWK